MNEPVHPSWADTLRLRRTGQLPGWRDHDAPLEGEPSTVATGDASPADPHDASPDVGHDESPAPAKRSWLHWGH